MPSFRQVTLAHFGRVPPAKPAACNIPATFALPASFDTPCECFRFLDGHIRIGHKSDQIVRCVPSDKPFARPVIRKPNLMYCSAPDLKGPHTLCYEHASLNFTARCSNRRPCSVDQLA